MNQALNFENLSESAMQLSAQVILDAADIVFVLWPDGSIADVSFSETTSLDIFAEGLKNRDISEIVLPGDVAQVTDLVASARKGERPKPVKLHHSPLVQEGSIARYSAHLAGDGKKVVMLGTALSAELSLSAQAANAEIARHRRADLAMIEERYRLLFDSSSEGLLVVDHASGLIEQANGNAAALIGRPMDRLVGTALWSHFADNAEDENIGHDATTEQLELTARAKISGESLRVSSRTVRSFLGTMMIVRLNRIRPQVRVVEPESDADGRAVDLMRQTSVPILLTDHIGTICWCNGAFAALVSDTALLGAPVADILGISPSALTLAFRQAKAHGRAPTSLSALDSRLSIAEDAHLTIVAIPSGEETCFGVLVHMVDARPDAVARPESSALAELVGKAPLKILVRKSTSAIERSCIDAALRLTNNNRAAAANLLGLSRQSLYLKIREHGLG